MPSLSRAQDFFEDAPLGWGATYQARARYVPRRAGYVAKALAMRSPFVEAGARGRFGRVSDDLEPRSERMRCLCSPHVVARCTPLPVVTLRRLVSAAGCCVSCLGSGGRHERKVSGRGLQASPVSEQVSGGRYGRGARAFVLACALPILARACSQAHPVALACAYECVKHLLEHNIPAHAKVPAAAPCPPL
eukprot:975500-Pleurochrysis_carterae.AAC.1